MPKHKVSKNLYLCEYSKKLFWLIVAYEIRLYHNLLQIFGFESLRVFRLRFPTFGSPRVRQFCAPPGPFWACRLGLGFAEGEVKGPCRFCPEGPSAQRAEAAHGTKVSRNMPSFSAVCGAHFALVAGSEPSVLRPCACL